MKNVPLTYFTKDFEEKYYDGDIYTVYFRDGDIVAEKHDGVLLREIISNAKYNEKAVPEPDHNYRTLNDVHIKKKRNLCLKKKRYQCRR